MANISHVVILQLEVNPEFLVAELNYDNNVAHCNLWYSGYQAKLSKCRYESLLDYRPRGRKVT